MWPLWPKAHTHSSTSLTVSTLPLDGVNQLQSLKRASFAPLLNPVKDRLTIFGLSLYDGDDEGEDVGGD